MNELIVKQFEGKDVRMMSENDEPWFVLADVLKAMGTTTPVTKVVSAIEQGLGKGFTSSQPLHTAGGVQNVTLIQAPAVTFVLSRSNTDEGRRLNQWVHSVVLPSVRKNGGYIAGQEHTDDPALIMARGLQAAQSIIDQKTAQLTAAKAQLEEQAPKVGAFDRLTLADGAMCVTDAAKAIQVRPKDLFDFLIRNQWIYHRNGKGGYLAYQHRIQQGYLCHKITTVTRSDGSEKVIENLKVAPKGIAKLAEIFQSREAAA